MSNDDDAEKKAAKAKAEREKKEAITTWYESTSVDDVVWEDDESKWILLGNPADNKRTRLQSIKSLTPSMLTVPHLKGFCVKHRIGGYKKLDKTQMCDLIVKFAKTKGLKNLMYGGGEIAGNDGNTSSNKKEKKAEKKKKKKSKGTKPVCVTQEGTYYRFLLALFAQELRPLVVKIGHQPSKNELDKRGLLHGNIFEAMAKYYNDTDRDDLKTLPTRDDFYTSANVEHDVPSEFDVLTAEEMSELLDFCNFHYGNRMSKCRLWKDVVIVEVAHGGEDSKMRDQNATKFYLHAI